MQQGRLLALQQGRVPALQQACFAARKGCSFKAARDPALQRKGFSFAAARGPALQQACFAARKGFSFAAARDPALQQGLVEGHVGLAATIAWQQSPAAILCAHSYIEAGPISSQLFADFGLLFL